MFAKNDNFLVCIRPKYDSYLRRVNWTSENHSGRHTINNKWKLV